jgi:hypothetical protein
MHEDCLHGVGAGDDDSLVVFQKWVGTPIASRERLLHGDCLLLVLACVDDFKAMFLCWMVPGALPILGHKRLLRGDCPHLVLACVDNFKVVFMW